MNIGDLSITNFYVGDIQADKICLGAEQVWPNTPPGPDYASMYLTVEIISAGTFYISNSGISYSLNDGAWTSVPRNTSTGAPYGLSVSSGDKIRFKGNQAAQNAFYSKSATTLFDVYGNILSLEYGDNFIGQTQFLTTYRPCYGTFRNQAFTVTGPSFCRSAEHLILPPTVVEGCYRSMFQNNYSLIKAPVLPATTLATGCYFNMFGYCSGLTEAPELPATTLANECYREMFSHCNSLTTAPELPAPILVSNCYNIMFNVCTSLNYIKCLATDISAQDCLKNWVEMVSTHGTFVKAAAMTSWPAGNSGIPDYWTVVDA